jgi:hypothetical protein
MASNNHVLAGLLPSSNCTLNLLNDDCRQSQSYFESVSYVTTDGQSASLSWNAAPIWALWPEFYYCQTVAGLLMWGNLSDERMNLSLTIAAGSRQHSHSQVWVLWESWPYFTDSDLRLSFLLPPMTRRAVMDVFNPTSTQEQSYFMTGGLVNNLRTDCVENIASKKSYIVLDCYLALAQALLMCLPAVS